MKCRAWLVVMVLVCAWMSGCGERALVCEGVVVETDEQFLGEVTWKMLVSGAAHSCGLTMDGEVYCWGGNTYGQLGHCSAMDARTPVRVGGEELRFVTISAGDYHTVGTTEDGEVYAWGRNQVGQLGDGTRQDRIQPVRVLLDEKIVMISAGANHTLALGDGGIVYAWGRNLEGQLGDGTAERRTRPVRVAGEGWYRHISAGGNHSLGIVFTNFLYAWGSNESGQLGVCAGMGEVCKIQQVHRPTRVHGVGLWMVSAGRAHSVGISSHEQSKTYGWGDNQFGQVGRDRAKNVVKEQYFAPVLIADADVFEMVEAGANHTMALTKEGVAYGWGSNQFGQLGDGTMQDRDEPVPVKIDREFWSLSPGGYHTVGLGRDGVAYGWGNGFGLGSDREEPRALQVQGLEVRY